MFLGGKPDPDSIRKLEDLGVTECAFGMPDKPHYGVTHTMINNVVTKIKASRLNVIALFWSDWQEPQSGEPGGEYERLGLGQGSHRPLQ